MLVFSELGGLQSVLQLGNVLAKIAGTTTRHKNCEYLVSGRHRIENLILVRQCYDIMTGQWEWCTPHRKRFISIPGVRPRPDRSASIGGPAGNRRPVRPRRAATRLPRAAADRGCSSPRFGRSQPLWRK